MHTFVDRNGHPYRAAQARQSSLDATNPRVRTIQREIAQRYEQLSIIPNDAPVGDFSLEGSSCHEALTMARRHAERWQDDRTLACMTAGGCNWENEGGAPQSAATRHALIGDPTTT
jgi:hypothetical protein